MPEPVWDDFSSSFRERVLGKEEVHNRCLVCGKVIDFPRKCSYCKGVYCEEHSRPEIHNCKSLPARGSAAYKALKLGEKTTLTRDNIEPNYKRPNLFGKPMKDVQIRSSTELPSNKIEPNLEYSENIKIKNNDIFLKQKTKRTVVAVGLMILIITGLYYTFEFTSIPNEIFNSFNIPISNIFKNINFSTVTPPKIVTPEKPFKSVDELIAFLKNDNLSNREWTSDYTCEEFSREFISRVQKIGYNTVSYYALYGTELSEFKSTIASIIYTLKTPTGSTTSWYSIGLGDGHAVCKTTISGKDYLIDPQTDVVLEIQGTHYSVVYMGEITQR